VDIVAVERITSRTFAYQPFSVIPAKAGMTENKVWMFCSSGFRLLSASMPGSFILIVISISQQASKNHKQETNSPCRSLISRERNSSTTIIWQFRTARSIPHTDKSIGESRLDGNLIIHGDNLHALKALLPMYAGRVDCIFIDPPYNTGNEGWCYNDNVNSPMLRELAEKQSSRH
jgi:hypothetical protein